jgi:hypothetical protein
MHISRPPGPRRNDLGMQDEEGILPQDDRMTMPERERETLVGVARTPPLSWGMMSVGMRFGGNHVYHQKQECYSFAFEGDNLGLAGLDGGVDLWKAISACLVEELPSYGRA